MEDKNYKLFDIIIKAVGVFVTALTIYIGIYQFNEDKKLGDELDFRKSFWQKQNDIYSNVCRVTGTMAANINNKQKFDTLSNTFLNIYYGEIILVEDKKVDSMLRELKSYLDIIELDDREMTTEFKAKAIALAEICKKSSEAYRISFFERSKKAR